MPHGSRKRARVLLLSAYHSRSHAYWCEGLMREFPEYDWTLKTQPSRHFSWRVAASEWIWALGADDALDQRYDLIIATSLSGLPGLKALRPNLARTPTWVYFHENQFAHPLERRQLGANQVSWQFSSFENALCSDWISFNTAFNRDTFFSGLTSLLQKMPERLPGQVIQRIEEKSDVLAVPLSEDFSALRSEPKDPSLIVWNHRWEWDKQPKRFLRALIELKQEGRAFSLAMLGCGGADDERFSEERAELGRSVVHWGEAEPDEYRKWIARAGIGVSCAIHDFQGLAMLELAQAGATVVVPRRVAYPECLPNETLYEGSADDEEIDVEHLKQALQSALAQGSPSPTPEATIPRWRSLRATYAARIEAMLSTSSDQSARTFFP